MPKTPTKATEIVAEFSVDKDTPNAIRFKQDENDDGSRVSIGSLYITKKALTELGNSKRIRVTVEAIG